MRFCVVAAVLLVGCGGANKIVGTYRSSGGPELILSGDGTYRYLIGERTSAQDSFGTYKVEGDRIAFKSGTSSSRFTEATVTSDGFAIKTTDGQAWRFVRE